MENPDRKDSKTTTATVKTIARCPKAGLQECVARTVYRTCTETGWEQHSCPEGTFCRAADGKVKCTKKPKPKPPRPKKCKPWNPLTWGGCLAPILAPVGAAVSQIFMWIGAIAAALIVLFILFEVLVS